jgi:dienelactone hydrolase
MSALLWVILAKAESCDSLAQIALINPGSFEVSSINESNNIRNGPEYAGATIYYPTNTSELLHSIILVPGFMNGEGTIQNWGPFLASHGIVTMTIGANNLTNIPTQRKDALLDAVITLKAEHNRAASPLYNMLDTNSIALGGFSMGGGGAQLAAVSDSTIKAIIALYPWLDSPTEETLNHNTPLLIISGELDIIATPSQHANLHYTLAPDNIPKQRYEVQYATHDPISGPNGGGGDVGIKVLAWLQTFLIGNHCYCPTLPIIPETASDFISNVECETLFIQGCVDTVACNYNPSANVVDGSCTYAENLYDCEGNCLNDTDEDGICDELEIAGCQDETACNYNNEATDEDDSCVYSAPYYDCEGNCLNDTDEDGICDEYEVLGCTDILACNYNWDATDEDGSCEYIDGICDWCDTATGTIIDNDSDDDGICDDDEIETYNCINAACIDPGDNTGTYTSLAGCEAECYATWKCFDGDCYKLTDGAGEYTSLVDCEADCTPLPSWDCVTGGCVDPADGSGFYANLADCEAECHISAITGLNKANKKLKKITNLLGQEIPIRKNTPMFYIYDDGSVEKKIIIE